MRIGFAQINSRVGDFERNTARILSAYRKCVDEGAEFVITPELSICGYPPGDLIFDRDFVPLNLQARDFLASQTGDVPLAVGHVDYATSLSGKNFTNSASLLLKGEVTARADKCLLPTFDRFNETRYFFPAPRPTVWRIGRYRVGIAIGEDIWSEETSPLKLFTDNPPNELAQKGADIIVNMAASPYHRGKPQLRTRKMEDLAASLRKPIVFCNAVGATDEWIYDGYSLSVHTRGKVNHVFPGFQEDCSVVDVELWEPSGSLEDEVSDTVKALVLGVQDTVLHSGFDGAVVKLDETLDSVIGLAITREALGPQNVEAVAILPEDAGTELLEEMKQITGKLEVPLRVIGFDDAVEMLHLTLASQELDVSAGILRPGLAELVFDIIAIQTGRCPVHSRNRTSSCLEYRPFAANCNSLNPLGDLRILHLSTVAQWINQFGEIIPASWIDDPFRGHEALEICTLEEADRILRLLNDEGCSPGEIATRGLPQEAISQVANRAGFLPRARTLRVMTSPSAIGALVFMTGEFMRPDLPTMA